MQSSFVWLFQRVFACTPTLMVSVMILLANCAAISMGENVAGASATEIPPTIAPSPLNRHPRPSPTPMPPLLPSSSFQALAMAARTPSHSRQRHRASPAQIHGATVSTLMEDLDSPRKSLQRQTWPTIAPRNDVSVRNQRTQLEHETTQRLVAPVVAHLESGKYACFDRTDLEYQPTLAKDPDSAVLLSNFAQFLFLVRCDSDRAEQYFHRAMEVDPQDSTILGRFATFLWSGRGNRSAAERAMAAEPGSSYSAGSYAHFLWHAGDDDCHGRV